nr:MAG TPA: hypothetical protein [Caudoviricetes sp.]
MGAACSSRIYRSIWACRDTMSTSRAHQHRFCPIKIYGGMHFG